MQCSEIVLLPSCLFQNAPAYDFIYFGGGKLFTFFLFFLFLHRRRCHAYLQLMRCNWWEFYLFFSFWRLAVERWRIRSCMRHCAYHCGWPQPLLLLPLPKKKRNWMISAAAAARRRRRRRWVSASNWINDSISRLRILLNSVLIRAAPRERERESVVA